MPKMLVHAPRGVLDADARTHIATALTDLGLDCESLPKTDFVRSTVWIYFNEYAADAVFMAGRPATVPIISLQVYALAGGLDEAGKRRLIAGATDIFAPYTGSRERIPVYVVIREVAESDWGLFGKTGSLEGLRAASADLPPLG